MNLGEMLYRTAAVLQRTLRHGVATAGSATTLVDDLLNEPADFFDGGTLFLRSGTLAGQTRVITDWSGSAHTFTFPTLAPASVAAGQHYAALSKLYSRESLVAAVNQALHTLGPLSMKDDTLVIVAQTERYALPATVTGRVVQVQLEQEADLYSRPYQSWQEVGGYVYLDPSDYAMLDNLAGLHIRIWYEGEHAQISADADTINADIAPELLATAAAWQAATNKIAASPAPSQSASVDASLASALEQAQRRYPVQRLHKTIRLRGD